MSVETLFTALRKKQDPLEGSFNYAIQVFYELPITCPNLIDYSCGRGRAVLPEALSDIFGLNKDEPGEREVFLAATQSNTELEREARVLIEIEGKRAVFRVEGESTIEEVLQKDGGELVNERLITNHRSVYLQINGESPQKIIPGSDEHRAFKEVLGVAKSINKEKIDLLCETCSPQVNSLPRSVV